jgi:hypothetical protein
MVSQGPGFEAVDADAVCEACGTVNDEGTLLCKQCGNNLRDQRARRIAKGQVADLVAAPTVNRARLATGILTALGIAVIIYVVINIGSIEQGMVDYMKADSYRADAAIGSSRTESILNGLGQRLSEYSTGSVEMRAALENPVIDTAYTGRYILIPPGPMTPSQVVAVAEAELRGERVYFVARTIDGQYEIRGYAQMEDVEGAAAPVSRDTAQIIGPAGITVGRGLALSQTGGGHLCIVSREGEPEQQYLAFRMR